MTGAARARGARAATRVRIPGLLRSYTGGAEVVDVELAGAAPSVADALAALDARYPGLAFRLVDEQHAIRPHIKLFVDRAIARDLAEPIPRGAELMIVGALSGG
ncbi:MAG: MoaD/ThiS family protein [Betaproteobacteria bacterium]